MTAINPLHLLKPRYNTLRHFSRFWAIIFVSFSVILLAIDRIHFVTPLQSLIGITISLLVYSISYALVVLAFFSRKFNKTSYQVGGLVGIVMLLTLFWVGISLDITSSTVADRFTSVVFVVIIWYLFRVVPRFVNRGMPKKADNYEKFVKQTIYALRHSDSYGVDATMADLNTLEITELLAELCLWVEDVTADKSVDDLLAIALLPLPENPKKLVDAVNTKGFKPLHYYSNGNYINLVASMLALIVSLQEAGERLPPK